jgi:hypothetical protein
MSVEIEIGNRSIRKTPTNAQINAGKSILDKLFWFWLIEHWRVATIAPSVQQTAIDVSIPSCSHRDVDGTASINTVIKNPPIYVPSADPLRTSIDANVTFKNKMIENKCAAMLTYLAMSGQLDSGTKFPIVARRIV